MSLEEFSVISLGKSVESYLLDSQAKNLEEVLFPK